MNPYVYADNDAVNRIDSNGKDSTPWDQCLVGAAVAAGTVILTAALSVISGGIALAIFTAIITAEGDDTAAALIIGCITNVILVYGPDIVHSILNA